MYALHRESRGRMRMGPSAIPTGALRSRVTSVLLRPRWRPRSGSRGARMAAASLSRLETAMGTAGHIRPMAVPRAGLPPELLGAKSPKRVVQQWLRCPTRHYSPLTVSAGTTVAGRDCLPLGSGAHCVRFVWRWAATPRHGDAESQVYPGHGILQVVRGAATPWESSIRI